MIIGIDVGNSDVKTARTETPTGFIKHGKLPFGADTWIEFYGEYYVPTMERFPYRQDKTGDENLLVLTMFGIAKEIIARLRENGVTSEEELRQQISQINTIHLGVGLPPAHYATLRDRTQKYYLDRLGHDIAFSYNNYKFNLHCGSVNVFPQDYVAAVTDKKNRISREYSNYVAVDVGGYTVDVVQINQRKPEKRQKSMPMGIFRLYDGLIDTCMNETGITLSKINIETVLRGEKNVLPEECIRMIHSETQAWVNDIISKLVEAGYELRTMPCLFIGGGALLLRPYIERNKLLSFFDFIGDVHANAIGYEKYVALMLRQNRQ